MDGLTGRLRQCRAYIIRLRLNCRIRRLSIDQDRAVKRGDRIALGMLQGQRLAVERQRDALPQDEGDQP